MCGIAGFIDPTLPHTESLEDTVRRMTDTLLHRGPDDNGVWSDAAMGLAFGHARLSIQDLSPAGFQPMVSASGRYVIVYNGEVYNFRELREELDTATGGPRNWRGHSDTEVMLACIERWGLDRALEQFNGMFAFALWDREEKLLHLVRDRLGKKPLYYGMCGNRFLFASELSALRRHPAFDAAIDRDGLALLLNHDAIPAPFSIFEGVHKLPAGCRVTLNLTQSLSIPEPRRYWSALDTVQEALATPWDGSFDAAVDRLDALLRESVKRRMVADVPLGVFLSGGIDSSTIAGIMSAVSPESIKTFSIGFSDGHYNEAQHAKKIARHLGTDHTELYVSEQDALDAVRDLPRLYAEPFADSSQIPTYLVSKMARQKVTVVLSGDGGDELFGGYEHYRWFPALAKGRGCLPPNLRRTLGRAITRVPPRFWESVLSCLLLNALRPRRITRLGEKMNSLGHLLQQESTNRMYHCLLARWRDRERPVTGLATMPVPQAFDLPENAFTDAAQRCMFTDSVLYLAEDILTKVDRASMAVSLEARVPLLDPAVYAFAWRLPQAFKIRDGVSKAILRQVLYRYVPQDLVERPKMGFSVPLAQWLRGPLKDWAADLLEPTRLRQEGYLNSTVIGKKWKQHLRGERDWASLLWNVLMFQAWLRKTVS